MKKVISIMLFVVMILSIVSPVQADSYGEDVDVNVMSYNIYHGVGLDGELDLERIAKVMSDADAEIIGIQEVDRYYGARSDFQDQAKELAEILGYHYVYGANLDLAPAEGQEENRQYGTAILSKYPIIDSENVFLSSFGQEQRGLLHAVVNVRGIHLNVYNTHLGLTTEQRLAQVNEIVDVVNQQDGPNVLVGDLNAEPDSEEYQNLLEDGGFIDTFPDTEDSYTFPVLEPTKRIDYILTSEDVSHQNSEVIYSEAADHLPLITELTFYR